MVLGNPDEFSVIIEKIEEWNENEDFCNGLLFFCIGGDLLPDKIISSTLAYELHNLVEQLENIVVDKKMYNMAQHEAFKEMYTATFPEDSELDNDYQFDITPASFGDNNYCVFAVSNGEKVRIFGSKLTYNLKNSKHELSDLQISEGFILVGDLNKMILKLKIFITEGK